MLQWIASDCDYVPTMSSRLPADLIIAAVQIQSLITASIVFTRESLLFSAEQANERSEAILTIIVILMEILSFNNILLHDCVKYLFLLLVI